MESCIYNKGDEMREDQKTLVKNVNLACELKNFLDSKKLSRAEAIDVIATYFGVEFMAGNITEWALNEMPVVAKQIADLTKKYKLVNVEARKPNDK